MIKIVYIGGGIVGYVLVNLSLIFILIEKGYEVFYIGLKYGIEREMIEL